MTSTENTIDICKKCGKSNKCESKFCVSCGKKMKDNKLTSKSKQLSKPLRIAKGISICAISALFCVATVSSANSIIDEIRQIEESQIVQHVENEGNLSGSINSEIETTNITDLYLRVQDLDSDFNEETEISLIPEALTSPYAAYLKVLTEAIDSYYNPIKDEVPGFYSDVGITGARLIDFDGDGLPELIFRRWEGTASYIHIYGYSENTSSAEFYFEDLLTRPAGAVGGQFDYQILIDEFGVKYLYQEFRSNNFDKFRYYTVENGSWIKALDLDIDRLFDIFKVNDDPVPDYVLSEIQASWGSTLMSAEEIIYSSYDDLYAVLAELQGKTFQKLHINITDAIDYENDNILITYDIVEETAILQSGLKKVLAEETKINVIVKDNNELRDEFCKPSDLIRLVDNYEMLDFHVFIMNDLWTVMRDNISAFHNPTFNEYKRAFKKSEDQISTEYDSIGDFIIADIDRRMSVEIISAEDLPDWKSAYRDFLEKFHEERVIARDENEWYISGGFHISLIDLTFDNIPELIIIKDGMNISSMEIYYYSNTDIKPIQQMGYAEDFIFVSSLLLLKSKDSHDMRFITMRDIHYDEASGGFPPGYIRELYFENGVLSSLQLIYIEVDEIPWGSQNFHNFTHTAQLFDENGMFDETKTILENPEHYFAAYAYDIQGREFKISNQKYVDLKRDYLNRFDIGWVDNPCFMRYSSIVPDKSIDELFALWDDNPQPDLNNIIFITSENIEADADEVEQPDIPSSDAPQDDVDQPDILPSDSQDNMELPDSSPSDSQNIIIRTAADLAVIGGAQSEGKTYVLANDINITGNWTPIDDFRGTLDGAGHVITGLRTNVTANTQSAGLFGTISAGNVTIKNLGVETGTGSVKASFQSNRGAVRLYAGGLIGRCIGGTVSIENCYFNGNIDVQSRIFDWVSALSSLNFIGSLGTAAGELIIMNLLGNVASQAFDYILDGNSYAYAGGLIGAVEGNAKVSINNSYSRGNVYAWASTHNIYANRNSYIYSGGLVGYKAEGSHSTLSVGNCYSTANVMADGTGSVIRSAVNTIVNTFVRVFTLGLVRSDVLTIDTTSPYSYAGGLFGRRNPNTNTGNNYRLSTQTVIARNINGSGTPLSNTALQNRSSFVGWNFNDYFWTINPIKNNGYPYPWIFDNKYILD